MSSLSGKGGAWVLPHLFAVASLQVAGALVGAGAVGSRDDSKFLFSPIHPKAEGKLMAFFYGVFWGKFPVI